MKKLLLVACAALAVWALFTWTGQSIADLAAQVESTGGGFAGVATSRELDDDHGK